LTCAGRQCPGTKGCATQTDRLIIASGRGDAAIANAIRDDSEFRVLGFVLRTPSAN
jgi:hypothetical protein